MTDISTWYKNIPRFTKIWLSATVGISLLARFGIVSPENLTLHLELVFMKFQFWRPLTALFYYPLLPQKNGLNFVLNVFSLYNYSLRLESYFQASPAEYFAILVFNWLCCVISALIFKIFVLMDIMVASVYFVSYRTGLTYFEYFVYLGVKWMISAEGLDLVLGLIIAYYTNIYRSNLIKLSRSLG